MNIRIATEGRHIDQILEELNREIAAVTTPGELWEATLLPGAFQCTGMELAPEGIPSRTYVELQKPLKIGHRPWNPEEGAIQDVREMLWLLYAQLELYVGVPCRPITWQC